MVRSSDAYSEILACPGNSAIKQLGKSDYNIILFSSFATHGTHAKRSGSSGLNSLAFTGATLRIPGIYRAGNGQWCNQVGKHIRYSTLLPVLSGAKHIEVVLTL